MNSEGSPTITSIGAAKLPLGEKCLNSMLLGGRQLYCQMVKTSLLTTPHQFAPHAKNVFLPTHFLLFIYLFLLISDAFSGN